MFKGHVRETQAFRYQVWLEETIPMLSGVVEAGTHTYAHTPSVARTNWL